MLHQGQIARHMCRRVWPVATGTLAYVLLIAGCTSLTPIAPADRIHSGRFSAITSTSDKQDNVSGRFTLAVRQSGITLDLASPLGNTLARMHTDGLGATLTAPQPDGSLASWQGPSPEALAEQTLGWTLPVSGLADWIEGRAVPGRPVQQSPVSGLAQIIEQDGWTIQILERFEQSMAPRRLSFRRPGAVDAPAISVQLVVDATEPPAANSMTPRIR